MTNKTGVWILGAYGGVATTAIVGLSALRKGLTGNQGLVSQLPPFAKLDLLNWDQFVVGGHDIRKTNLYDEAMQLARVSRAIDREIIEACRDDLAAVDANIRPGVLFNVGPTISKFADETLRQTIETPRAAIGRVQKDLESFAERHRLDRVIAMNLASTEPPVDASHLPAHWSELAPLLERSETCSLAASSLYAIAALELGFPYINFTPSLGSAPSAIDELAIAKKNVPHGT